MKNKRTVNSRRNIKKRKSKKIIKNKGVGSIFRIIFILGICTALFCVFEYFMNINKELISKSSISYYIDIADKYSKPKQQLNWKEIAAIYGAKNGGDLNKHKEKMIEEVVEGFYDDKDNNGLYEVRDFERIIETEGLTKKERKEAVSFMDKLKEVSIRQKIEGVNSEKEDFINRLKEPSIKMYKKYNVLPSIAIAQAILESNWGKSELASNYNNYYGIKADKSWKGKKINFSTKENYNDVIKANFRAYSSVEESIYDLGKFLNENSRYKKNGLFDSKNYIEQAQSLENAGYSTASNNNGDKIYADLLIEVIRENNLMIYDCNLN